jgi:CRISPR-associated protein Cmr5
MTRSLDNDRAAFAYEKVSEVKQPNAKEFRSLVRSVPAMIQMNGLGATAAYLYSKKGDQKNHHDELYDILSNWSKKQSYMKNMPKDLMEAIMELDSNTYRRLTKEMMQLMMWIKRFAEGMIPVDKE